MPVACNASAAFNDMVGTCLQSNSEGRFLLEAETAGKVYDDDDDDTGDDVAIPSPAPASRLILSFEGASISKASFWSGCRSRRSGPTSSSKLLGTVNEPYISDIVQYEKSEAIHCRNNLQIIEIY